MFADNLYVGTHILTERACMFVKRVYMLVLLAESKDEYVYSFDEFVHALPQKGIHILDLN